MTAYTIENIAPPSDHSSEIITGWTIQSIMSVLDEHIKVTAEVMPDQSRSGSWKGCYYKFFIKHGPFMAGKP
jgi:hypothetical protein